MFNIKRYDGKNVVCYFLFLAQILSWCSALKLNRMPWSTCVRSWYDDIDMDMWETQRILLNSRNRICIMIFFFALLYVRTFLRITIEWIAIHLSNVIEILETLIHNIIYVYKSLYDSYSNTHDLSLFRIMEGHYLHHKAFSFAFVSLYKFSFLFSMFGPFHLIGGRCCKYPYLCIAIYINYFVNNRFTRGIILTIDLLYIDIFSISKMTKTIMFDEMKK